MSRFWFSPKNLARTARDILLLFRAVDNDLDEFEAAIQSLDDRVSQIDGGATDSVTPYKVYRTLIDQNTDYLRDENGELILIDDTEIVFLEREAVQMVAS